MEEDDMAKMTNGDAEEATEVKEQLISDDSEDSLEADNEKQGQNGAAETVALTTHKSHFRNEEAHTVYIRYGVPIFLVSALTLLINADIGSGVSAEYILLRDGEIQEQRQLLLVSVFSSVTKLWENESYPLAILIALTSIAWPYVKLLLAFYAWFAPYQKPRRREFAIEIVDALGKWSFVDIVVLVEIMVAFRSTIMLAPSVTLEILIAPKWGFYGFVIATMMNLVSTHYILYLHRKVHYHSDSGAVQSENDEAKLGLKAQAGLSNTFLVAAAGAVLISLAFYIVSFVVDIYTVTNTRGETVISVDYSIVSVGKEIPGSQLEPNHVGIRFIQAMWFFLCVAMPLWCSFLFGLLFLYPFSRIWVERIFFMGEIAFAWSCAEVLLISTIFSVVQMPTFGDGLIQADCSACFVVDTEILPNFAFLCIGTVFNVGTNVWLYRKAHKIVYHGV